MLPSFLFNFLGTKFRYVLIKFFDGLHWEEEFGLAEDWSNRNRVEANTGEYNVFHLKNNEKNFLKKLWSH